MNLRIGQKVVCIDGDFMPARQKGQDNIPVLNGIYHIRALQPVLFGLGRYSGPQMTALLVEIVNDQQMWIEGFCEAGFAVARFRPVVERKIETDISVFTAMLKERELERL